MPKTRRIAVSPDASKSIQHRLEEIEAEKRVEILFAVESGSRAWHIHSEDSDFDVRGVYRKPTASYLTTAPSRPDTIERSWDRLSDEAWQELEVALWDVDKACDLLLGGNAAIREWIDSPIRYRTSEWVDILEDDMYLFWDPRSYSHHYVSLAKNNYERYVAEEERPLVKKYIYIVRALVQAKRIWNFSRVLPLPTCFDMELLLSHLPSPIAGKMEEILRKKQEGGELGRTVSIPEIEGWVRGALEDARERCNNQPSSEATREDADLLFHRALECS